MCPYDQGERFPGTPGPQGLHTFEPDYEDFPGFRDANCGKVCLSASAAAPRSIAPQRTAPCRAVPHCTALHRTALHCTATHTTPHKRHTTPLATALADHDAHWPHTQLRTPSRTAASVRPWPCR